MPRFTIERLRTVVLIGGGVLIAAIAIFLGLGQWKLYRQLKDLPKRLGVNIQQQADGVDYTQSRKGKTLFKLHAARAVQMKINNKMLLHDVRIDLYGDDGKRTDTISGSEFEYDRAAGIAEAAGSVEISLMRPGVKPAITQLAEQAIKPNALPGKPPVSATKSPQTADNEVHVKTSGLSFNQNTGIATTSKRVDFVLQQGRGSSTGATYNSTDGQLVLDHDVALHADRDGDPVDVRASHAEFLRKDQVCEMVNANADYSGGKIQTGHALIHFRDDGSVIRLDGSNGIDLKTDKGSHVTAPRGNVEFDQANHPRQGLLQGGTNFDLAETGRRIQGSAPTARLVFVGAGELHHAHLEKGVTFTSQQQSDNAKGVSQQVNRNWKSEVADVDFVKAVNSNAKATSSSTNQVEPRTIHGTGGVTFTSDTVAASGKDSSRLSADDVIAELAPGGQISTLSGRGHTAFEQRTAQGAHQTSTSDQLDVRFLPPSSKKQSNLSAPKTLSSSEAAEIASITQVGNVILEQDSLAKSSQQAGPQPGKPATPSSQSIRATASRSDYDGSTQILHLSGSPRVRDGELDLSAVVVDFSRSTGNATAHGNVKATWASTKGGSNLPGATLLSGANSGGQNGNGPIHAIAPEAILNESTQEITFRSDPGHKGSAGTVAEPRLWQAANSIVAPSIILNRQKQTLDAQSNDAANPVRTVLVTNASSASPAIPVSAGKSQSTSVAAKAVSGNAKEGGPSILRLTSGDLNYSEGERVARLHVGLLKSVTAQTTGNHGTATIVSQTAEVRLLPAGIHPAQRAANSNAEVTSSTNSSVKPPARSPSGSIDQLTAQGKVSVIWPDRQGTGEKLVYLGESGDFTLTGSGSTPPRITDQTRGTVTGNALIYHTRDDSVTVEGDGSKTSTEAQAPKKRSAP